MKNLTAAQMAQRALDYQEIQNVMAAHSYCYEAQKQWEELDNFWSKRDDIAYGTQHVGRQSVIDYYCKTNETSRQAKLEIMNKLFPDIEPVKENEGIGDMVIHLLTTPYITIAGDGQTAKGLWYGPSICCEIDYNGEPVPVSIMEKCAVDFIKEDGEWKIWHYRQLPEFMTRLDKSVVDGSQMFQRTAAEGLGGPPAPPKDGPPGPEPYSTRRVAGWLPELPAPYETWDDTMSYIK
jgi:hypothetical protein